MWSRKRVESVGCLFPIVQVHSTSDTLGYSYEECVPELLHFSERQYLDTSLESNSAQRR
jgi:hypothetical protein